MTRGFATVRAVSSAGISHEHQAHLPPTSRGDGNAEGRFQGYRGKAAVLEAKKRESLLVGGDEASTFVVDDDPTRRTLPVASDVVVDVLETSPGGARSRARASLSFFAAKDAGDSEPEPFERAWEITLKDGKVVRIDEVER